MGQLERDRRTWLTYAQLGVWGYFLYGFGPALTLLRADVGFSRTIAGAHGTALAVGALLSALCVASLSMRFGRTAVMWAGLVLVCLGAVVFTAFTAVPLTMLGALMCSFGGNFVVTCTSTVLATVHEESGAAAITEANAVAAAVGAVAPLVIGAAVAVSVGWRAAVLLVVPIVAIEAIAGRRAAPVPRPQPTHDGRRPGRLSRRYWIAWGVVTGGIAVEFCLTLWSADLLRHRVSLSEAAAAAAVTALVAGMAVGRALGGQLALRFSLDRILVVAVGVNAAGFALLWLPTWAPLAIAGLAVSGLGVALYFPLGLARAIGASDGRPDQASARVGLGAALASGGGPFVLGALADQVGIHAAMLVVPGLFLMILAGIRLAPVDQRQPSAD